MTERAGAAESAFWGGHGETDTLQRYRALLDATGDGIYRADGEGRLVGVNDALVELTGYAREELLGEHVSALVDGTVPERRLVDPAESGDTIELAVSTAGGDRRRCELRVNQVDAEYDSPGTVGVVRERAEGAEPTGGDRELAAAGGERTDHGDVERYETIVETIDDGVYVVDEDGYFVTANEAYAAMTGYDREELIGEHVSAVVDEDVLERARRAETAMADDGAETPVIEAELANGDGDRITAEATFAMLDDADGPGHRVGVVRDITERKRVERRLAEERDVFAQGPAVVFRWRNEEGWPVEYVSENVEDVLGYAPAELESGDVPYTDLLLDEERDRIAREVAANSDGTTERFSHDPYRVRTGDGDVRWVTDTTKVIRDEDREITHYLGYLVDITERKERERALEESRRRYRALVEQFPNGAVALVDEDLRYGTVGGSPRDVVNADADEMVGRAVDEVVPAELADELVPCYEAALDGETRSFETELENGVFEFRVVPLRDEDGEVFAALGMSQDVTERTERERELRRTERRFEAVFEDPNILVGLLDPDGTVLDINRTAMEYVDADLDAVTGEPFWETPWWGEGDDVGADVREWTERAAAGEYVEFEADLTRPDGEHYTLEGFFRPVTDDDGDVVSVIVSDRDVTERKEHERQLEESERRYRALAENFPNGLVTLFDHDLRYTLAAGHGFDSIPIDPSDVEGKRFDEVWNAETVDALEPVFEAVLDGEERSVEVAYAGRDWVVRAVPVTDTGGDVFAGMTMAQDITERKERERELTKYETIVETINDGIYVKDEDGYFTMVNETYAEMTGYDREELVGAHASLVVDEDAIDRSREVQTTAAADGTNPAMEATIETADGDTVPAEATFSTIGAGDGERKEVGVVRDVTERNEQRRKIEESERRYRTLVEHFPNGAVALFDEDLEYTVAGGEILEDLGTDAEEIVGQTVWDRYPEELAAQFEPRFRAAIEDGETNEFDLELHERHWLAYTLPVRDSDGDVFAGMMMVQDVTERREYQRKLEQSNERLEQFAYAASHDLQEPLRMVSSYLQMVERRYADELDEDGREFIEFAVDGADRMRDMVEGLLEYSRVDTRGDAFEPVDLEAVVADVREDLRVRLDESDAEVTVESLPEVAGDAGQLRQVFQNLLDNAVEYSGDDPPQVRISAERNGSEWHVSVSDDGIGIEPAETDRVFEVFQRLHAPDDHSGTGIGLALCERIVERHDGDIWVESEPGNGSTFTFTLPAKGQYSD